MEMINGKQYVDFIVKHGLTQSQFLLLHLIYERNWESIRKYRKTFPADDDSMIGQPMLQDLIRRGFLIPTKPGAIIASEFKLGVAFKSIFIDKLAAIRELIDLYPKYLTTNTGKLPLTVLDVDAMSEVYWKKILRSRAEHDEVKEDILYGISNGILRFKLESFIRGEIWKTIRKERIEGEKAVFDESGKITEDDF